jgi:hypothetical protein
MIERPKIAFIVPVEDRADRTQLLALAYVV